MNSECSCSRIRVGLTLGILLGGCHALWLIAVAISQTGMQKLVDWIMKLHSFSMTITVLPVDWLNALILVVLTFVCGFVIGWVFMALVSCCSGCCRE